MTNPSTTLLHAMPILTGVLFGLMGWLYKAGAQRGVTLPMIGAYLGAGGLLFFGPRCAGVSWGGVPAVVWALGGVSAIGQLLLTWGARKALDMGPLSPVWCAMNLSFVPVVLCAWLFLGEPLNTAQSAAVLAGIGAVVLGSARQNAPASSSAGSPRSAARPLAFGLLLFGLLLFNSAMNLSIKILNAAPFAEGQSVMERYGDVFFLVIYAGLFFPLTLLFAAQRRRAMVSPQTLAFGAASALCSVAGLWMLGVSARLPAAYTFTVCGAVNILLAGLISIGLFHEKADRNWFSMMGCALVSVAFAGAG